MGGPVLTWSRRLPQKGRLAVRVLVVAALAAGLYFASVPEDDSPPDDLAVPVKRIKKTEADAPQAVNPSPGTPSPDKKAAPSGAAEPAPAEAPETIADNKPGDKPGDKPAAATGPESAAKPAVSTEGAQANPSGDSLAALPQIAGPTDAATAPAIELSAKVLRYAEHVLRTYDRNGSGRLEAAEWAAMRGDPREADANGDQVLTMEELASRAAAYGRSRRPRLIVDDARKAAGETPAANGAPAPESGASGAAPAPNNAQAEQARRGRKFYVAPSRLPQGLPEWFVERDRDGDGQLTVAEYSPGALRGEIAEFNSLDRNGDGLLTAEEYVRSASARPAEKPAASADGAAKPAGQ